MADYSACQLGIELGYEEAAEFGDDSSVRLMERLSSRRKSSSAGDFFVFIEDVLPLSKLNNICFRSTSLSLIS